MRPFNRHLRGFLGLLDAKVQGQAPEQFEDAVRVVLDAWPFAFIQAREVAFGSAAVTDLAEGYHPDGGGTLIVPSNEVWIVQDYCIQTALALLAGETLRANPAYQSRSTTLGLQQVMVLGNDGQNVAAGAALSSCANRPFIVGPGDNLGAWVNQVTTAANIVVTFVAAFVRCRI